MSGGRLILGVGLGFPPTREFEQFGEDADPQVRAAKLDEGLDVLTGLWSGMPFRYEGQHYRLQETLFWPPPVQRPRIPVWVAGHWPKSLAPFRRAARWNGVCPEGSMTFAEQRAMMEYIRRHRPNHEPFDVVRSAAIPEGDIGKRRAVIEEWAEAGVTWWITSTTGRPGSFEDLRRRLVQGPPQV